MNILVFAKNWLGDVVFETSALRVLKENFPDSHLAVALPPRCVELLAANPHVDELIPFDERAGERSIFAKWRFVQKLRSKKFDRAYLFHRSATRAFLSLLGGAKERIGYGTKGRGFLLTQAVRERTPRASHDTQYFLDLLRDSGLRVEGDYAYDFFFAPEDFHAVQVKLKECGIYSKHLVAINPGANWEPKRWPAEHFGALAKRLANDYGVQVIVTGSDRDEPLAAKIVEMNQGNSVFSFCGKTTLRELGALFSLCKLVISNDSGPIHIASGVGTNVLGIFGPTDPKRTGPLGKGKNVIIHYVPQGQTVPWYGKQFPYGTWLECLTPEEVFQTIQKEHLLDQISLQTK